MVGAGNESLPDSRFLSQPAAAPDLLLKLLQELLEVLGGDTTTAAQELAVVTAQLMLEEQPPRPLSGKRRRPMEPGSGRCC